MATATNGILPHLEVAAIHAESIDGDAVITLEIGALGLSVCGRQIVGDQIRKCRHLFPWSFLDSFSGNASRVVMDVIDETVAKLALVEAA